MHFTEYVPADTNYRIAVDCARKNKFFYFLIICTFGKNYSSENCCLCVFVNYTIFIIVFNNFAYNFVLKSIFLSISFSFRTCFALDNRIRIYVIHKFVTYYFNRTRYRYGCYVRTVFSILKRSACYHRCAVRDNNIAICVYSANNIVYHAESVIVICSVFFPLRTSEATVHNICYFGFVFKYYSVKNFRYSEYVVFK